MNSLAHNINQFKRNYSLGLKPVDKNRLKKILDELINCKSVSDLDESIINDARNFINSAVEGNDVYSDFYDEFKMV